MNKNQSFGEKFFNISNLVLLAIISFSMILPFLNMLSVSISDTDAVRRGEVLLWPVFPLEFSHWGRVFVDKVLDAVKVTVFITLTGSLLTILMCSVTAYPLSKKRMKLRSVLMMFFVITMIFQAPMIPGYLTLRAYGFIDSIWVMIIPGILPAFYIVLARTFFMEIPDSLEDSARIDGCNELGILFRVYMPLSKALLATLAIFSAVGYWNTYQAAILFIRSADLYPLQYVVRKIVAESDTSELFEALLPEVKLRFYMPKIYAATVIFSAIPIVMVYPFVQKYFVKGIMIGSIKG